MVGDQDRANPGDRMIRRLTAALLATVALGSTAPLAHAEVGRRCHDACVATASGGQGVIDVTYTRGKSEQVPGRKPIVGTTTWTQVEEAMAPTCAGNSRVDDSTTCAAAITSCPDGLVRFWVWHQVTTYTKTARGKVTSEVTTPWYQEAGSFCLGADDPGVPNIAKVIDLVRTQFASLPLQLDVPQAAPAPTTLVNIPTAFSAGSAAPQTFTPTLLGTRVTVTATPVTWTWTWGDGTSEAFDRPGVPRQPDVTHRYLRAGDRTVTVQVEWRGTFRIGDDPTEYPITTPAYKRSAPVLVRVRTARSQLVR
jgi:hypothetical protein